MQPGHRRPGQGPHGARDRRPGRTHGHLGRQGGHPVPQAQYLQGPRRARHPRANRPHPLHARGPGRHLRPGRPLGLSGHGRGRAHRGRARLGRAHPAGRGLCRAHGASDYGHLPLGADAHRREPFLRRTPGRPGIRGPVGQPARTGDRPGAAQDGHHPAPVGRVHRLRGHGGAARRRPAAELQLPRALQAAAAAALPHHLDQRAHPRGHPRGVRPLAHVLGRDHRRGRALLPQHRGQGRPLPREVAPPAVHRARGPGPPRGLPQRHPHQPAPGRAEGHAGHHPGAGERPDRAPGLRHRIRFLLPHAAQGDPGGQGRARALHGRADQRHLGLRGGRRPGPVGRAQRRRRPARRGALRARARRGLHGRVGGRPSHQGHRGALPHVHLARRAPAAPARGQRRRPAHGHGPRAWAGGRRPLGSLQRQARRRRGRARRAEHHPRAPRRRHPRPTHRHGRLHSGQGRDPGRAAAPARAAHRPAGAVLPRPGEHGRRGPGRGRDRGQIRGLPQAPGAPGGPFGASGIRRPARGAGLRRRGRADPRGGGEAHPRAPAHPGSGLAHLGHHPPPPLPAWKSIWPSSRAGMHNPLPRDNKSGYIWASGHSRPAALRPCGSPGPARAAHPRAPPLGMPAT